MSEVPRADTVASPGLPQQARAGTRRWREVGELERPDPAWSPDGDTLAFLDPRPSPDGAYQDLAYTVMTVRPDGSEARDVHAAGHCLCLGILAPSLTWSPDGELITVAVTQGAGGAGIYTVRPDGFDWERLDNGIHGDVDWQPVPR